MKPNSHKIAQNNSKGLVKNRRIEFNFLHPSTVWEFLTLSKKVTIFVLYCTMYSVHSTRRLLRSSQPRQIFQPRPEGFYSVQDLQGFVIKGINHTGQIFLTRPSVSSCVRHGCHLLEKIPADLSDNWTFLIGHLIRLFDFSFDQ